MIKPNIITSKTKVQKKIDSMIADFHVRRDAEMKKAFEVKFGEKMTSEHMKLINYKPNCGNYWMVYQYDKRDFFAISEPKTVSVLGTIALQANCYQL